MLNNANRRPQNLNIILVKDPIIVHFHRAVQRGLASHANDDAVGLLTADYLLDVVGSYWEEEDVVGLAGCVLADVGLDGGDVGVL